MKVQEVKGDYFKDETDAKGNSRLYVKTILGEVEAYGHEVHRTLHKPTGINGDLLEAVFEPIKEILQLIRSSDIFDSSSSSKLAGQGLVRVLSKGLLWQRNRTTAN